MTAAGEFQRHHDVRDEERVLQEKPTRAAVLRAQIQPLEGKRHPALQKSRTFVPKSVGDGAGTAPMKVVDLGSGTFQITVVVEQLKTTKEVLPAATDQGNQMGRPKKPMPMHLAQHLTVAFGQVDARNTGGTLETGKTSLGHPIILTRLVFRNLCSQGLHIHLWGGHMRRIQERAMPVFFGGEHIGRLKSLCEQYFLFRSFRTLSLP